MNTTNLITDYIVSGVLGLLGLVFPLFMINNKIFFLFISSDFKNQAILTVGISIIGYAFGVIFNQIADFVETLFYKVLKITIVQEAEKRVEEKTTFNHYYALQFIVTKSEFAYDYISFRRTMIRIVRALLCLFIFIPIIHLIYSIIFKILGYPMAFSGLNTCIIILIVSLIFVSYKILLKISKGYYEAITNFTLILKE